jgi:hypothetical protein
MKNIEISYFGRMENFIFSANNKKKRYIIEEIKT